MKITILNRFRKFLGYHDSMDPYLEEFMPLLILYRLAARGPFGISEDGNMEVQLFSFHGLYFVLSYGFISFSTIESYRGIDVISYFTREDLAPLYNGTITVLIGVLHFSVVLSFFTKWATTVNYFEEWAKLNVEYKKVMGHRHARKCGMMIQVTALFLPCAAMTLVPTVIGGTYGTKWYHMSIPISIFVGNTTEFFAEIFTCMELMFMGTSIDSKLKSLIKSKRIRAEKVYELRRLWVRCSRVVRLTGMKTTYQLILDVAGSAALFSVASFALFTSLVLGDLEVAEYLSCVFSCCFRLFVLFEAGEMTTHYVGHNIRFTISTARIESIDVRAAYEVELFIQSISSNYPTINFKGFSDVSRRVLFMILTQATFYIIVLVQMRLSAKSN